MSLQKTLPLGFHHTFPPLHFRFRFHKETLIDSVDPISDSNRGCGDGEECKKSEFCHDKPALQLAFQLHLEVVQLLLELRWQGADLLGCQLEHHLQDLLLLEGKPPQLILGELDPECVLDEWLGRLVRRRPAAVGMWEPWRLRWVAEEWLPRVLLHLLGGPLLDLLQVTLAHQTEEELDLEKSVSKLRGLNCEPDGVDNQGWGGKM